MKKNVLCSVFFLFSMFLCLGNTKFTEEDLQNKLKELAKKTDKIMIFYNTKQKNSPKIELKGKDIKEFFSLLKFKIPEKLYYCRCPGTLLIVFYSNDKRLGSVSYHHSISVRASFVPLHSNIDIVEEYREKMKEFLLEHGVKADKLK
jgi:hypothetical protein